jgi:hypothetical protein
MTLPRENAFSKRATMKIRKLESWAWRLQTAATAAGSAKPQLGVAVASRPVILNSPFPPPRRRLLARMPQSAKLATDNTPRLVASMRSSW